MPSVTITISDTPSGGVNVQSNYTPSVGEACSPAQSTALELVSRTRKQWGLDKQATPHGDGVVPTQELQP